MIPSWQRFRGDFFNGWEEDGEPECKTDEEKAEEWKRQVEEWYGLK